MVSSQMDLERAEKDFSTSTQKLKNVVNSIISIEDDDEPVSRRDSMEEIDRCQ